jgi:glucose/mannose-6-phosphate isomerase
MKESILNFAKQFSYKPEIINKDKISNEYENFILGGMGGSHLAAGILRAHNPGLNLYIHRDYGIPEYDDSFNKKSLFIASSYSGNTEEVLDFADEAYTKGYEVLVISTGGKLIDFAKENNLAYIQIPDTGIQPRLALGYSTIALASVVSKGLVLELQSLENKIIPEKIEKDGMELAEILQGKTEIL